MANDQESGNPAVDELEEDQVTLDSQASGEGSDSGSAQGDASSQASEGDEAEQIEQLQAELAQAKEQALRAAAELQNVRRRAEQDIEKAHKFGLEKFVKDMLPVVDNLERAIDAASQDGAEMASVVEGVELTLKSLVDGLKRQSVDPVNPEGEPFDPQMHQAMTMVEQPDCEPNTVINVFQKGYTLHGRLVRPAMVVVSKA